MEAPFPSQYHFQVKGTRIRRYGLRTHAFQVAAMQRAIMYQHFLRRRVILRGYALPNVVCRLPAGQEVYAQRWGN